MDKQLLKFLVLLPLWALTTYVFYRISNAKSFDMKRTEFQRECERRALIDTVNAVTGFVLTVAINFDIPREWHGWPTAPIILIGFSLYYFAAYQIRKRRTILK